MCKSVALLVALAALGFGVSVALADKPPSPPGGAPCEHGNSGKPCRPDPQPDHGKDCNQPNGDGNEDHCAGTTTGTTGTTGTTLTTRATTTTGTTLATTTRTTSTGTTTTTTTATSTPTTTTTATSTPATTTTSSTPTTTSKGPSPTPPAVTTITAASSGVASKPPRKSGASSKVKDPKKRHVQKASPSGPKATGNLPFTGLREQLAAAIGMFLVVLGAFLCAHALKSNRGEGES